MSDYRFTWNTTDDTLVILDPDGQVRINDGMDQIGFDVDVAEKVANDMLAAVEHARKDGAA